MNGVWHALVVFAVVSSGMRQTEVAGWKLLNDGLNLMDQGLGFMNEGLQHVDKALLTLVDKGNDLLDEGLDAVEHTVENTIALADNSINALEDLATAADAHLTDSAKEILQSLRKYNPLANKTTPELIRMNGYPVEIHSVTTEDGYILELHRIPHGKLNGHLESPRPVIFMHHCLLCSSSDFIMNSPDKALAYLLADNGYDVWMTNARGNTYSKNHVSLSPDEKEFWDFSWNEMAYYDVPAALDYTLLTTGADKVHYLGFSMGSTIFWAMLSQRPEYADKIKSMVALGPVAYTKHVVGPIKYLSVFVDQIEPILNLMGRYEMFSFGPAMDSLVSFFCDEERFTANICHNFLFFITGANPEELNKEFLPVILSHTPAGTSIRTLTHYMQEANSGNFEMYNYGKKGNMDHYGSLTPPKYNLSLVTPPVALFWSDNDWLANPTDVLRLIGELPNVIYSHRVEDPNFTHLDFVWARHADQLLYHHILRILDSQ